MGGNPRTYDLFVKVEEAGGWDSVFDAISDGALVKDIAARFGASRGWFSMIAKKDPERARRWEEAMLSRADAMAEDAVQIADDADAKSPGGVQKAKLRAELRQWLAGVDNGKYRRANAAQVQVNIGQLHLDALRWLAAEPLPVPVDAGALPAVVEDDPEPENTQ